MKHKEQNISVFQTLLQRVVLMVVTTCFFVAESGALTLQPVNKLQVGEIEGRPGTLVNIPISLVNSDEVVSVQFDVTLPFSIPTDATPSLTARANGHSANFSAVAGQDNKYRVVVMTLANRALRGNKGILLNIPMQAGYADVGLSYAITLSDVVLADKNGHNIATDNTSEGHFVMSRGDLPDLVVKSVSVPVKQSGPGKELTVSYTVANEGGGSTGGGWAEKVYLQGSTGEKTYLGMQNYLDVLAKDATLQRSMTVTLPQVLHVDGECHILVEVVPFANTGELATDRANNSCLSATTLTISKQLRLTTNKTAIREGQRYGYATLTLTRSGDWSRAESFKVSANVSNLVTCNGLTLPYSVTIPARAVGVTLRIASVNDAIVRAQEVEISIAAQNGYAATKLTLQRIDDDRNLLSLTVSPNPVEEGQTLTVTATRGGELTDELTLTATCSAASRFSKPFVFHFEADAATSTIEVEAIDNEIEELDCDVLLSTAVTAGSVSGSSTSADGPAYSPAKTTFKLLDNDRPALTMTLSLPSVTENMDADDDGLPLVAIIQRDRGLAAPATVYLSSSRSEVFFENSRVTIPAGASRVEVPIHVTDNSAVDGTRRATLTATLFVTSAGRTAPVGDRSCAVRELTILDDEQPYITLSSRVQAVAEGSSATVTVRRVQADVSAPLSVSMHCDDARVTFQPTPVIIAAGSLTATTTVKVARNDVSDDDEDILIRAEAVDLGEAYLRMHVTDRTLPDAVCTMVECVGPKFYAGLPTTLRATVRNYGTKALPQGLKIACFMSSSYRYYRSNPIALCEVTTDRELAPGDEAAFEFEAQLPERVGAYYVWATVNADRAVTEYDYGNNLSRKFGYMNVLAPFQVSAVSVSAEDCLPGDVVIVSGRMTAVEEGLLNGQAVRVQLVGSGQNSSALTLIDAEGNFSANVRIDRSAHGYLTVKALAVGQTEAAMTTRVHIYNQSLTCAEGTKWVVKEGQTANGTFKWSNTSGKPITVGSFVVNSPLPDGCTVNVTPPTGTIAAGQSVNIAYTVTATKPSSAWQDFSVTATSVEGVVTTLPIKFRCQATTSWLVFTPSRLRTTMLFGNNRNCSVTVKNIGLKATGAITPLAQDGWVIHDAARLGSLEPGAEATVNLTLLASEQKHVGRTYTSSLQLKPDEGPAVSLPIEVKVTGQEFGHLVVRAGDVYSIAQADYSHLAGATVAVRTIRGNRLVHSGQLDAQGTWQTEEIEEGAYDLTVTAPRHKPVTQRIFFGPGEEREETLFLPYQALVGTFVLKHDDEGGFYYMDQSFDIDREAPQAIVAATIADRGFECGENTMDIVLQNVGTRTARRTRMSFPFVNGCSFTLKNDLPATLEPGETYVLHVAYKGPENARRRYITSLHVYYAFDINGETYGETDDYSAFLGCDDSGRPVIVPPTPDPSDPTPDDPDYPEVLPEPWSPMPTYGTFFRLELDEETLRVGQPTGATLIVRNGSSAALRNMRYEPGEADTETYDDCTPLFSHSEGEAEGFTADGQWRQLAAGAEGRLHVSITPLADAAANGQTEYLLGGQLRYTDPTTGIATAASLYDYLVTVQPGTGEVQVTYLLSKHVLTDDPTTSDTERTLPATFAVLVQNMGATPFESIALAATMPDAVADADGQPVGLMGCYAALNGQAGNYSFEQFSADNSEGADNLSARWVYTADVPAHITDIESVAPVAEESSVTKVTVNKSRELVRTVSAVPATDGGITTDESETESTLRALTRGDVYLVNDVDDELSLPDVVITAEGEESDLEQVTEKATVTGTSTTGEYRLHVTASVAGWIYARVADPTAGLMRLTRVTRQSDNAVMDIANFWQTDVTPQADYTAIQENIVHLADKLESTSETYLLHFEERPDAPIRLMGVRLFTADGTEVADAATTAERVTQIQVETTGALAKVFLGGVALRAGGRPENLESAVITSASEGRRWTIDISALEPKAGEHSLTIDASRFRADGPRDVVGTATLTWTEQLTESVSVAVEVTDVEGSVSPGTGSLAMGTHEFVATPAEGYRFVRWIDRETGEVLGTDATLTLQLESSRSIVAVFAPVEFAVTVTCDHGTLLGMFSGIYPWGQEMRLAVQPDEGYVFSHWERNGLHFSDDVVTADVITAGNIYTAIVETAPETAVRDIIANGLSTDIYTITGMRLPAGTSLPRGVYIVGRNKILKK